MMQSNTAKQNNDSSINKTKYDYTKAVLVLCEECHWCSSIFKGFDTASFRCPNCRSRRLSSFPIVIDQGLIPFKISIRKKYIVIS